MPWAESVRVPSRSKITNWALTPALSPMRRLVPVPGPGVSALLSSCGKGDPVSVRLCDVIEVLDGAYPPGLAQDWDSVGLVCGDPSEPIESVTVAVDATAEVVSEVGD